MGKPKQTQIGGIDFKRVFNLYLRSWYLFVLAIAIAFAFAMIKNRYIIPMYSMSTSVLIEDKSNKSVLDQRAAISGNPLFVNSKLIDNQVAILKSFSQIKTILEELEFRVSYFAKGKYTWQEIYKRSPFTVIFDKDQKQLLTRRIDLKLVDNGKIELWSEESPLFKNVRTYKFDEPIKGNGYSFQIKLKDSINPQDYKGQVYGFIINDLNQITSQYRKKTVISTEKDATVINISSTGPNKEKEKDYLNELTRIFLKSNLEKKNRILTSTIDFIDGQLKQLGEDLRLAEQKMEEFRQTNKFMQLSAKSAAMLSDINSESKSRANLTADLKYYEYLKDYIQTHNSFEDIMMPSTVGLSLPLFSDLVLKLSTVILEKDNLIANSTRNNPYIKSLEEQIINMKHALLENMISIINTTQIKIDDVDKRLDEKNAEFSTLPGIEREYLGIERQFNVFNNLYDFLLNRKSEVEIQRAANTPDHEIIDNAGESGISTVSTSTKTAYVNALIWAFLLPSIFLFLVVLLNNRIMSADDIESITEIPIVGSLIRNTDKRSGKLLLSANSKFTEMLRIIRIKLNLEPQKDEKVILVTSSFFGDGKTFIAINLASMYALAGKRSLLLGFDLQRPKIAEYFGFTKNEGITNYLINDMSIEQITNKTYTKNLDVILSGPIPPNHDELIESERAKMLFAELRKKYDYIIMDTPSIGVVGDAFLLNRFADITLFVVRYNHTTKKQFTNSLGEAVENRMKRIHIVFTDLKQKVKIQDLLTDNEGKGWLMILPRLYLETRRTIINLIRRF
jgi:capsular exopolysaccharide synthesis family protein